MNFCITKKAIFYCDLTTKKLFLIFFLSLVTLFFCPYVYGFNDSGQEYILTEERISVNFDNLRLDEAIIKISQRTNISINYSAELFDSSKRITFKATEITLSDLLEAILPEGITFELHGEYIILQKEEFSDSEIKDGFSEDTVRGRVVDAETGSPLPGVNILIKGTEKGTTTNAEGEFELSVDDFDETLVISFIGYKRVEIVLTGRDQLVVELNREVISGNELIVIGYGAISKEDLTGSVTSIDGDVFENVPAPRIDQILQGRAPGVQVTQSSGAPGASSTIRIRGGNSIQGDNSPLFVIDNFIVGTNFNLNNLNTNDIESIEVLKDATAVSIYGTRGANGVILITTKSGSRVVSDTPEITLNSYTGMQYMMNTIDLLSGPDQAAYANEDADYRNTTPPFGDLSNVPDVNWIDQITRNAPITNTDISVSGITENRNLNYYMSGNYFNQRGIIRNSGIQKYNLRTNLDLNVSNRVQTGVRLNITRLTNQNNKTNFSSLISRAGLTSRSIYDDEGNFTAENPVSASLQRNAEADILLRTDDAITSNLLGNFYLEVEPLTNLILRSNFGTKVRYTKSNIYNPAVLPENQIVNEGGNARVNVFTGTELLNENTILYTNNFFEHHNLEFLGGFTWQTSKAESVGASGYNFPNDAVRFNNLSNGSNPLRNEINSGWDSFQLVSWLARTNYSYREKYLLTFVGRIDGSSRFAGTKNKYAFFPSAAVAWQLGKEPFIEKLNLFDQLKIRMSYGKSGSQAINSFRTLPVFRGTSAFFDGTEQYAVQNGRPENENLKWETTEQLDIGFEAAILNNRLSFEVDYYKKTTNDLLLNVQMPRQTGFSSKLQNLGSIQNKGLEFSLKSRSISKTNFLWSTTLSVSGNRNKVMNLGGVDFIDLVSPTSGGPGGRLIVGESAPVFVGVKYLGTWKNQEEIDESGQQGQQVGGPRFKDTNGDGDVSVEDFEVLGSPQPDFFGGIQNTFIYKNWEMDLFIEGTFGNEVYNSLTQSAFFGRPESNKYADTIDRWTPDNSDSDIPRAGTVATLASVYSNSEMVEDGSYLRLKNLKLTYSVPTDKFGFNSFKDLKIYFSGSNLFLLSNFRLFDPEVNQYSGSNVATGFTRGEYPYGRILTFGVSATL